MMLLRMVQLEFYTILREETLLLSFHYQRPIQIHQQMKMLAISRNRDDWEANVLIDFIEKFIFRILLLKDFSLDK